jgi:predicted  nucleic acid-binding Zn-ribbon protein
METKEELITNIKEWIKIDNEIMQFQKEIKERRIRKKSLTDALMNTMKKNEIDCFDINGGSIVYKKNKVKKPLNGKSLMAALQKYYETKPQQAEEVTKFVMDNREEQIKEVIKRKVDK